MSHLGPGLEPGSPGFQLTEMVNRDTVRMGLSNFVLKHHQCPGPSFSQAPHFLQDASGHLGPHVICCSNWPILQESQILAHLLSNLMSCRDWKLMLLTPLSSPIATYEVGLFLRGLKKKVCLSREITFLPSPARCLWGSPCLQGKWHTQHVSPPSTLPPLQ